MRIALLFVLCLSLTGCLGATLKADPAHPPVSLNIYVSQCIEPANALGRLLLKVPWLDLFECQRETEEVHAPA